ncbi:MAG: hypothetical protein DCC64_07215 [Planctomycetota bacterium]|nr:MAG: hypothetical protein DCC64_07215 [Planctomycetota bacterium]
MTGAWQSPAWPAENFMALDRLLCCKNSKVWIPDSFLTSIVGDCDRGKFTITRPFTFPCLLLPNGNLYIEEQQGVELGSDTYDLGHVRCASCGSAVEVREIDVKAILDKLREREITMKERQRMRDSQKVPKEPGGKP